MILTPAFIILISLIFILVGLFAKSIDKRKWVVLLITIAATPVVYFYIFYPFINIFTSFHHKKYFNADAWEAKPALRYEMSENIIHSNLLEGKSKKDVEYLLGKSNWYSWDDSLKMNSPDKWNYNLGMKPGAFNRNKECLEIEFKNNLVKRVTQYQFEETFE
ncbi:hypothetical protein [Aestuariivivens sp. NBU2969]|uniref:hypothetical protein n=1 Tax=Aestuariivivens sp. NBU2969 TaxID=2873267 RepID=UPI001CC0FD2E|nr:hypothetical protein [Aestuariivivens sp. NBU2969]